MPVFAYSGTDSSSSAVRGTITADSPRAARDQLRGSGVRVRKINLCDDRPKSERSWRLNFTSHRAAWGAAVHELSMMLGAGIPMLESLDTIADQQSGSFREAVLQVRDKVAAGSSLADALSDRPDLFDAASVHMVEVGENSGTLDTVLAELAEFKRKQMGLQDSVTTALVYPIFLVAFGLAAAVFLMTWVLPPLLENLQETMDTLPWPTRVVRAMSDALIGHWFFILVTVLVAMVTLVGILRSDKGRRWWHRTILRLPLIGPMAIKQNISRIAMVIATLARSGVELTRAVELAETSTHNVIFKDALRECGARISAGQEVSDALEGSGAFPPLAVRVFSVGQESGKLDEMLFRLSEDYDRQVAVRSARMTALIEPVMILFLAAMVGFLLLATVLPILEAGNVVG